MVRWNSALIGVVGTLGGGLLGASSTYLVARAQLQAHQTEITAQIGFQQREARIARLVDSRKPYLLPLREAVSKMASLEEQQVLAIGEFVMARSNRDSAAVNVALERMRPNWDAVRDAYKSTQTLRGENVDVTLDRLIDAAGATQMKQTPERAQLHTRLLSVSNFNDPAVLEITRKYDTLTAEVRQTLIAVNKRIEELLAGDAAD